MYVIARNASGRPTVQHRLNDRDNTRTGCGYDMSPWSRAYMNVKYKAVFCKLKGCQ